MKAGGGKNKGSAFERKVCITLSKWISDGRKEDIFWRSSTSGGRATVSDKLLSNQAGDVSAIDPIGSGFINQYVVECKHLRELGLESAILNHGPLVVIWAKLLIEAGKHDKQAFLVMRQNRWPTLLGLNKPRTEMKPLVMYPRLNLHVYYFDHWIDKVPPDAFIRR